jgi:hypothetical protein
LTALILMSVRCGPHDVRFDAEATGRQRHTLRVIAR